MEELDPSQDEFLFKSRKGKQPLTLSTVSHLVGSWFEAAGLKGLGGARALRRTWQSHFEEHAPFSTGSAPQLDSVKALEPIEPVNTLQETVYQKLFEAIVTGRITPGERLMVDKVAAQMNVSRMPVREALHRLHEAGLVSLARRRGTVVNKLSVEDLREITRIRLILECEAAEEGARLCSDESLRNLEAIHRRWVKVDERRRTRKFEAVAEYLRLNRQFHHAIYTEARMPILMQIITGLWDRVYPYLHILLLNVEGGVGDKTVSIHQGMIDGMKRRDPKEVSRWVREDLSLAAERLIRYLERFGK
jgi:DNA-binding GntR family transcriptional regulator